MYITFIYYYYNYDEVLMEQKQTISDFFLPLLLIYTKLYIFYIFFLFFFFFGYLKKHIFTTFFTTGNWD